MYLYLKFRSIEDQEILFDQILMGQLEFPVPYWDHVSDTAKVGNRWTTTVYCIMASAKCSYTLNVW